MEELRCDKARKLVDELLDDRLDESQRHALDTHLSECEGCQAFREGALKVRGVLGAQQLREPSARAMERMWSGLQESLEEPPEQTGRVRRLRGPWPLVGAGAAALAAAAVAWLVIPHGSTDEEAPRPSPRVGGAGEVVTSRGDGDSPPPERGASSERRIFAEAAGEHRVERGGAILSSVAAGRLVSGDALLSDDASNVTVDLGPTVRVALGPETRIRLVAADDEEGVVALESGWAVFAVEPGAGVRFEVRAEAGTVRVTGTFFAVEVGESGLAVRVHEGSVEVLPTGAEGAVLLPSGRAMALPDPSPARLETAVARRDRELFDGVLRRVAGAPEPFDVEAAFEGAEAARRSGNHRRAAALYARIVEDSPSSPATGTALVSLGQLYLGPLEQPARARRVFRRYLAGFGRGSLRQEALVGALRSEVALGRRDGARELAEQYLRDYPSGRYQSLAREHATPSP